MNNYLRDCCSFNIIFYLGRGHDTYKAPLVNQRWSSGRPNDRLPRQNVRIVMELLREATNFEEPSSGTSKRLLGSRGGGWTGTPGGEERESRGCNLTAASHLWLLPRRAI